MKRSCVDDETILDYLEGRLNRRLGGRVEKHLCICADCRDLLMLAGDIIHGNADLPVDSVPSAVTQRAIESVAAISKDPFDWRPRFFSSKQRLMAGGRSLLDEVAPGLTPQFADLRSGTRTLGNDFIRDRITCSRFEAIIEIEQITDTQFALLVKMTSKKSLDKPLRVSLLFDGHEIASATLLDEAIQLENFSNGRYALIFSQGNQQLSVYRFKI